MPPTLHQITELIKAAQDRNLDLSQFDINVIKNAAPDSELAKWLMNFDPSQILTTEELQIWQCIQRNGIPLSNSKPTQPPLTTDHQLQNAISSLQASTLRLQTQTEILNKQRAILFHRSQPPEPHETRIISRLASLQRKQAAQSQQTHLLNAVRLTALKSHLQPRLSQLEKQAKSLPPIITERLNVHDRLLSDLETQANAISHHAFNPTKEGERAELLLRALEKTQVQGLKDRLDRTYLENLHPHSAESPSQLPPDQNEARSNPTSSTERLAHLKAEIETLYTEIPSIAAMQVDAIHGQPLRLALQEVETAQAESRERVLRETKRDITTMTDTLDALTMEIRENRSQRHVIARLLGYLDGIERDAATPSTRPGSSTLHEITTGVIARSRSTASLELSSLDAYASSSAGKGRMTAAQTENSEKITHESLIRRMRTSVEQRRAAVDMLVTASRSSGARDKESTGIQGSVEGEIKVLEARIEGVRRTLEALERD